MNKHLPLTGLGSHHLTPGGGVFGQRHFRRAKQSSTGEFCGSPVSSSSQSGGNDLCGCKSFKTFLQGTPLEHQVSLSLYISLSQEVWRQPWEQPRGNCWNAVSVLLRMVCSGLECPLLWVTRACHSLFERECVLLGFLGQDSGFVRYLWDEAHILTSMAQH